jgi:putative transposase
LLACYRYIELNPVRASMVGDSGQYRWSSYRANGLGQADARLTPHGLYLAQGRTGEERRQAYRALFRPQLDAEAAEDIRQALRLSMPVGQERFAEAVCAQAGIRFNSGKRGRPEGQLREGVQRDEKQADFGF